MPRQPHKVTVDSALTIQAGPRAAFRVLFLILVTEMALTPLASIHANGPKIESGQTLFQQFCRDCHGSRKDGTGSLGPLLENEPANLNSPATQSKTNEELFSIIKHGGGIEMHGWADTFSDQQIHELVRYLRHPSSS